MVGLTVDMSKALIDPMLELGEKSMSMLDFTDEKAKPKVKGKEKRWSTRKRGEVDTIKFAERGFRTEVDSSGYRRRPFSFNSHRSQRPILLPYKKTGGYIRVNSWT